MLYLCCVHMSTDTYNTYTHKTRKVNYKMTTLFMCFYVTLKEFR